MNSIIHKADSRGRVNHGWLDSNHTFSFGRYHDPQRMNFGVVRVLNDDIVAAGQGFGTHPHENMEIISIPLEGDLEHKDSMGNKEVIREGDIQVMSAGTGVYHSEYNHNDDGEVKFLQIWLYPNQKDVEPRYDQISIREVAVQNQFYQILSPNSEDQGVWIHQDAWFSMADLEGGKEASYSIKKKEHGVYIFVIEGELEVNGEKLEARDGLGIWNSEEIKAIATKASKILLMDVPMRI